MSVYLYIYCGENIERLYAYGQSFTFIKSPDVADS